MQSECHLLKKLSLKMNLKKIQKKNLSNLKVTYICVTFKLRIMQRDIQHTWFFPHAPEMVWEFLTDAQLLAQWLMENNFKPVVGHTFQFNARPKIKIGFDGIVYGEVLDVVPRERLSYSWKGGPGKGKITLDSVVTWTLHPKDNGTELVLTHSGFKGLKNFMAYVMMNEGWRTKIKARFEALLNKNKSTGSEKN